MRTCNAATDRPRDHPLAAASRWLGSFDVWVVERLRARWMHIRPGRVSDGEALAKSMSREELAERAFDLYAQFRPAITSGMAGSGAKGVLEMAAIRKIAG